MSHSTIPVKLGKVTIGRDTRRWGVGLYRVPRSYFHHYLRVYVQREWPVLNVGVGTFLLSIGRLSRLKAGHTPDPRNCPICRVAP